MVLSQIDAHAEFGGVVPEIAARAHLTALDRVIVLALERADTALADIDGIGVTAGPGLVGGLMVGLMTAKALAASRDIPWLGINHLEGHALTARLTDHIDYPYLLLLVSGGHTQILHVRGLGDYQRLATTIDDAAGETFDKTAKLLGLPYPGGPSLEKAALKGDPVRIKFPKPLAGRDTLNMSFSGLKTAVRIAAEKLVPLGEQDVADLSAALQKTIGDVLCERCSRAMAGVDGEAGKTLVVAGGVAANTHIRQRLGDMCKESGWRLVAPPHALCTDNGAMIGWAALERFELGERSAMELAPRARWPLDMDAVKVVGSGRRGAKV